MAVIDPLLLPQMLLEAVAVTVAPGVSVIVTEVDDEQLFASLMVTVYVPAAKLLKLPDAWKFVPSILNDMEKYRLYRLLLLIHYCFHNCYWYLWQIP